MNDRDRKMEVAAEIHAPTRQQAARDAAALAQLHITVRVQAEQLDEQHARLEELQRQLDETAGIVRELDEKTAPLLERSVEPGKGGKDATR